MHWAGRIPCNIHINRAHFVVTATLKIKNRVVLLPKQKIRKLALGTDGYG